MNTSPDPLSGLLQHWRIAPPGDPQFRSAVWARLQAARDTRWAAYVRQHAAASCAALALAVVTGGWLGRWQAHRHAAQDREVLATTYLAEIDARVIADNRAETHAHH
jgi:hypothetical protein